MSSSPHGSAPGAAVIHPEYLPFTEQQLAAHFAPVAGRGRDLEADRHLAYYRASARRLAEFEASPELTGPDARRLIRRARQIEKDERFWVVAALMAAYHSEDRVGTLARLLRTAIAEAPPISGFERWEDCLVGELRLFFEANLPSPKSYRSWLRDHISERHFIPYVLEAAEAAGESLEGPTHVDALLLAPDSRFAVLFEAKVISDADSKVSFDVLRNQVARNIDVMLDENPGLAAPLDRRDPDRTCFVLLTPELFRDHPSARLYGGLMNSYQREPDTLKDHLPHRDDVEWPAVSARLGWLTFEDCERTLPGSCPWLTSRPQGHDRA